MIRALIFDFNGVLADDDPVHMQALRRVAEEEGLTFSDEEYLDRYLPLNDWDCFRTLYARHSTPLSEARIGEIRHILAKADIEQCFCAIVSAEDVRFGKPHPEPFLRAYEKLQERDRSLKVSDCVAVEDSIGGIQSAHEAGMRCLAIAHSYGPDRLKSANPDWVIDSIADFVSWLERDVSK